MPKGVRGASRSVIFVVRYGRTVLIGVRESTCRGVRAIIMHIRCGEEDRMRVTRVMANLRVATVEQADRQIAVRWAQVGGHRGPGSSQQPPAPGPRTLAYESLIPTDASKRDSMFLGPVKGPGRDGDQS